MVLLPYSTFSRSVRYLILLMSLGAIYLLPNLTIDNQIERWINPETLESQHYTQFREHFSSDEFIMVGYRGRDPFEVEGLDIQVEVLEALKAIEGVDGVMGIPAVYQDLFGEEDSEALRDEFESTPFYERFIYQQEGQSTGFIIEAQPFKDTHARLILVDAVQHAIIPLEEAGWECHLVGPPVLNVTLDQYSQKDSQRSFPIAIGVSIIVMLILFQSVRPVLITLICAGITILLTLGTMVLCARSMNMVSSVLPSLLWVLSLAGSIHLIRSYQRHSASEPPDVALSLALEDVVRPCSVAAITTAMGFLSLLTADLEPVVELGLFSAIGLLFSLVVTLCIGPWLMLHILNTPQKGNGASRKFIFRFPRLWVQKPALSLLVLFVLATIGLLSMKSIRIETDPLSFFPEQSEVVHDYAFIADNLSGYYSLEIVLDAPDTWLDMSYWPHIDTLVAKLESHDGVARVLSPLDILRKLNQWEHDFETEQYRLPENTESARTLIDEMDASAEMALARLLSEDGRTIRLSALIRVMASNEFDGIVELAESEIAAETFPLNGYTTGIVSQLVQAQTDLVHTQLRSFSLAFGIIFCSLLVGLRSLRLTLISVIPNLLPILTAFSVMALLGIALDGATVMMASVALGIAVDDTVHMLGAYQQQRARGLEQHEALKTALDRVGKAMVITTLTASIGFFALISSDFVPIAYFGLLSGLAIIAAFLADFYLLPALLLLWDKT